MIDKVIEDMHAGKLNVLVVWYSARIERRGAYDHFVLAHLIREAGGRIEYVMEPWLNEVNAMSDAFLAMQAGANKTYSDTLAKNVGISFDRIDANGAVRGRVIYGYRVVGEVKYEKTFEIREDEASVIRDAAEWYLGGQSLAMICRKLNGAGRLPRPIKIKGELTQCEWSPKTISQVLRSETIMGRHHQGDKVVSVPAILTVRQWRAVQTKLDAKAYRKGIRTNDDTAFLTSILYCEHGHPLYRQSTRNSGMVYYERKGCRPGIMVPLAEADQAVLDAIADMGDEPGGPAVFEREVIKPGRNWQDDIDHLALEIRDLDPLADDYVEQVTSKRAEIDRLRTLPNEPDHVETEFVSWIDFMVDWEKMTLAEKRELLISLGVRFYASKDGDKVNLRYRQVPAA
jgi:hypothetical protein